MTPSLDNLLAALSEAWKQSPHKLISLRDMIKANGRPFIFLTILEGRRQLALRAAQEFGPGEKAGCEVTRELGKQLEEFRKFCEAVDIPAATDHVVRLWVRLGDDDPITNDVFSSKVEDLQTAFWFEMGKRNFVFIPSSVEKYFEQNALFGPEVASAFPSAAKDIKDAGNCLAADLNTAAVFHLMRVAEHGLRALAIHLQCPLSCPIEFATWSDVANKIHDQLVVIKNTVPKSAEREETLQFYSGLVRDIHAFQYAWRDPVMHCRSRFDDPRQSEYIFDHIHRFMETLAKRVSEV